MAVKKSAVTVRSTAPLPDEVPGENPTMLFRPVPQLDDPSVLEVRFTLYSPAEATHLLLDADSDPDFHQRPLTERDVRRWLRLMESERFVNYLPNGPLCFDPDGMLLNGKHRLTALTRQSRSFGFMAVHNVPRWMFAFFDTMRVRSLNDVFAIGGRMTKAQTGSTMRLAMRFEEFLHGHRGQLGWRSWGSERDEHFDVDEFLTRRQELGDYLGVCQRVSYGSRLIVSSLMVWRFYQELAWPDGAEAVTDFCEALRTGSAPARSATATLRAWSRDVYEDRERIHAKRELHLLLLNRYFQLHVQGDRVDQLKWAFGFPMTLPYHPRGPEVAIANVRDALARLDKEAAAP